MKRTSTSLLCCCAALVTVAACTAVKPIRTEIPPTTVLAPPLAPPNANPKDFLDCKTGHPRTGENRQIIEDYGNYLIGFAEFDDQGWAYVSDRQLTVIKDRINTELKDAANESKDFLVLVFVHGWHHNAHDNDCNVQEFRQMVQIAATGLESGIENGWIKTHRRVIGIYVGWRGESVDADLLRYLTVMDRREVAERVAKGSVRQLFADLRQQQRSAQQKLIDGKPNPAKMRTVVIGHSFGGLIAFSAVSQATLNDLTETQAQVPRYCDPNDPRNTAAGNKAVWPDATILINPAFEASRYEPFDRLMKARGLLDPCKPPEKPTNRLVVPHFIVVTAEKDHWTGKYFTWGRSATTLFEAYDRTSDAATRRERTSNLHAIGFVDSYQTHRLELMPTKPLNAMSPDAKAVATLVPANANPTRVETPVWIVTASDAIVHGHDGFLFARLDKKNPKPYLANWLLGLYDRDCSAAPQMVNCPQSSH